MTGTTVSISIALLLPSPGLLPVPVSRLRLTEYWPLPRSFLLMKSELTTLLFVARCFSTFHSVYSLKYLGGRMSLGLMLWKIFSKWLGKASSMRISLTLLALSRDAWPKLAEAFCSRLSKLKELSRNVEPLICLLKVN